MPIDGLPTAPADNNSVPTTRHAWSAALWCAGRGAQDHDLVALLQPVHDLDELIALDPGFDHARRGLASVGGDVDDLVASLATHGAERDDQHVVLFVDGDERRGGQPARQGLAPVVDA